MRTAYVLARYNSFFCRKPEFGLLHHSDWGSQYANHEYYEHLSIIKMEHKV